MNSWSETYRGTVPPWECDITEHFTIAYYLDRLADSERNLAAAMELADLLRGAGFHRRFHLGQQLVDQRRRIDSAFDHRYSVLPLVFAALLHDRKITEDDLLGLAPEKLNAIRHIARS